MKLSKQGAFTVCLSFSPETTFRVSDMIQCSVELQSGISLGGQTRPKVQVPVTSFPINSKWAREPGNQIGPPHLNLQHASRGARATHLKTALAGHGFAGAYASKHAKRTLGRTRFTDIYGR